MRKILFTLLCCSILFSSCRTTESGAFNGAYFGSIIGSAVGGLQGGWRGERAGTLIGMATGAAVGAAVGHANEKAEREKVMERHRRVQERHDRRQSSAHVDNGGYNDDVYIDETNSGDDRIDFSTGSGYPSSASVSASDLQVRNIRFADDSGNSTLSRNETGKVMIEITNVSHKILYDITPVVKETTGNKHILVSPSAQVESIGPGQSIRYTAMIVADARLKSGTAQFEVSVMVGDNVVIDGKTIDVTTVK